LAEIGINATAGVTMTLLKYLERSKQYLYWDLTSLNFIFKRTSSNCGEALLRALVYINTWKHVCLIDCKNYQR
jgi:hypothetical protein